MNYLCMRLKCNKVCTWVLGVPRDVSEVSSASLPAGNVSTFFCWYVWVHVYVSCLYFLLLVLMGCYISGNHDSGKCLLKVFWLHCAFLLGGVCSLRQRITNHWFLVWLTYDNTKFSFLIVFHCSFDSLVNQDA